jgi:hypothetical protein
MSVDYELAPEVETMAKAMIDGFSDHSHLKDAKISYVFQDKAQRKSDGRTILGLAKGRNKLDKLLSPKREDFIMIIANDRWAAMPDVEKRALVDHELCHMGVSINSQGKSKFSLRGHPIEEFPENLGRFEHRRIQLGTLIQSPPSAIAVNQENRQIEAPAHGEEE